jgi:hypothetical protein
MRVECAGLHDDRLQARDLIRGQLGIAQQLVDETPALGCERLRVHAMSRCACPRAGRRRRLAGDLLVAEDAEHVVAQLEGHAERVPEGAQGGLLGLIGAGDRRSDQERLLDAVPRRLQRDDAQGAFGMAVVEVYTPRRLLGDVEELSDRDVTAHPGVLRADGAGVRTRRDPGLEQVIAPRHEQVAEQTAAARPNLDGVAAPSLSDVRGLQARCAEGRPRRVSELSIRSSCTSAAAWNTSSAAQASQSAVGGVVDPAKARNRGPSRWQNRARRRLPPRRVASADETKAEASGPYVAVSSRIRATKASRRAETWSITADEDANGSAYERDRAGRARILRGDAQLPGDPYPGASGARRLGGRPPEGDEMPLSEQEQRLLDEMERHLMQNDADVVSAHAGDRALSYRNLIYGAVLLLAGVGGLIVGVVVGNIGGIIIGVVAFAAMLGG